MQDSAIRFEPETAEPLAEYVMERSGQNLTACYQCRRCASGCPVGEETGYLTPDRLIRLILLGDAEAALSNGLVWKCVSCYTCGTRCPNQIQTARIVETLKRMSKEAQVETLQPRIANFHDAFVEASARHGRLNELEFMALYQLKNVAEGIRTKDLKSMVVEIVEQGKIGIAMLRLRRLRPGFHTAKGRAEVKRLFRRSKGDLLPVRGQSRRAFSWK